MSRPVLVDPGNAACDPLLPLLAPALDPVRAQQALARDCPALAHGPAIGSIHVIRHRPGRRCVVRYGFTDGTPAVLGKATAKGVHKRSLACRRGCTPPASPPLPATVSRCPSRSGR